MMSGLRSQRERMITWVSLRSGVASSGRCIIAQVPQIQAAATKAKIRNLFRTENPIRRLVIRSPRSLASGHLHLAVSVPGRVLLKFLLALVGTKCKGLTVIVLRVTAGLSFACIYRHAADRIDRHAGATAQAGITNRPGSLNGGWGFMLLVHH